MYVCEDGDNGFSVKKGGCGQDIRPTFTVRRNAAWDAMDAAAAFDDAYGQQLKEAGLASIGGRGTLLGGKSVSVQLYDFSDTFAGAVATESLNGQPASKKVAIDINRDVPLHVAGILNDDGTEVNGDQLLAMFLQHIAFVATETTALPVTTTSELTVLNDATAGFSISYPTASTSYEPSTPAVLAVRFGNQARLEVRSGATVDSTRGPLEGYRKLTEKAIVVNKATVNEERYVPNDVPGSAQRLLFVAFSRGTTTVGVSFSFSGDPAEEARFETILGTFGFSGA
jgi:hypothetical protein